MPIQSARSVVIPLLVAFLTAPGRHLQAAPPVKLTVVVVKGEGAVNNIKRRTSQETVVRVEDEGQKPVSGAAVAFLLPSDGPGGTFTGGAKSVSIVTGAGGLATMPHLLINSNPGPYSIGVYASLQGAAASATIAQSSATGANAGVSTAGIIGIVAGVAAATGVAMAVAAKGKSSPSTPASGDGTGTVSIGGGSTGFGPPR